MRSRPMRRRKFSEIQTNIELNEYGWFSVVIPEGRENLVKNPSLETNANGYVAKGGSIARTAVWQSHGAISLAVTPTAGVNDGMYYDDPSHDFDVSENTLYWPSFDFKADGGRKYKAYVARAFSGTQLGAAKTFTATGHRQRIEFPYREGDNTLVDSLTAYWKLGEATAATRLDSVGTNHLTPLGGANPGPSQTTGIINNAALFTRANSEYLNVADTAALSVADVDFSISCWVKNTSEPATMGIIAKGTGDSTPTLEYRLLYSSALDRFQFLVSNGVAATTVTSNAFGALATGVWYHIVAWHDSVNNVIGIRVNDSATDTAAHTVGCQDGAGAFKIGTTGAVANFLDAVVDEVGFWKKVLSATEITALYNGGFGQTYNFLQRRLYIVKDNETNTRPFYIDGLQFEAGDFPTTLAVGDMVGLVPSFDDYYWTGAPHASTSVRVANSGDGGRVMNLLQLGLRVISHVGLGMTGLSLALTPLGNGGAFYQGTTVRDRSFNIIGEINGDEYQTLDMYEQALTDAFSPNRVSPQQPIKLLYQPLDDCGNSIGETLEIACLPDGDFLQMQTDNLNARRLALPFRLYLPFAAKNATDQGTPLSYQVSFTANRFFWQDENGSWRGEDLSGIVRVILPLPDGTWAIGGEFTNAGGLADADYLVRYDPVTRIFSAFNATPLNNIVYSLANLPDGNVAIGGLFTNAGGDANADALAKLNLTTGAYSAFNATPLAAASVVYAIAILPDGNAAIAGNFLNAGADANADFLAKLNLTTGAFSSFNATPLTDIVYSLVVDKANRLVIGGQFLNAGADANADYICRMNLTTFAFSALTSSNPLNNLVLAIGVAQNGNYFIAGLFNNAGGDTSGDYVTGYNGVSFFSISGGVNSDGYTALPLSNGSVLFTGAFTQSGSLTFADRIGIWTGSAWIIPDVDLPGAGIVYSTMTTIGRTAFGSNTSGATTAASVNTIDNSGSDNSQSSYTIRGPGRIVSLKNLTNGSSIYFDLVLIDGEEATLTFSGSGATFTSNLRGNILGKILPGSNLNFVISSGTNLISTFITYTASELNDGGNQLSGYSLQGVTILNSDNGRLYVNIVNLGGSNRRADFYSDSARTQLVAQTGTYAAGGSQAVTQANSSGITGTLTVDAVGAADVDITVGFPVMTMKWEPTYASLSGAVRPRVF